MDALSGDLLAWDRAGRWIAGATLIVAAVYELTPLKDVCLGKCRSPLGFLLGSWRGGLSGALPDGGEARGVVHRLLLGADGVALRARRHEHRLDGGGRRAHRVREALPVGRAATWGTAAILFVLGVLLLAAPDAIPGFDDPGRVDEQHDDGRVKRMNLKQLTGQVPEQTDEPSA